MQEQKVRTAEKKLQDATAAMEQLEEKLASLQEDCSYQKGQIRRLKMELDLKESTIRKLSAIEQDIGHDLLVLNHIMHAFVH